MSVEHSTFIDFCFDKLSLILYDTEAWGNALRFSKVKGNFNSPLLGITLYLAHISELENKKRWKRTTQTNAGLKVLIYFR